MRTCRGGGVAGAPVGVLAQRHVQLGGYALEERGEEVDVLDEDVGVLHPYDGGALEFSIL